MQDNSQKEKEFEDRHTIRGHFRTDDLDVVQVRCCILPHSVSLLGIILIIVGPWALAHCTTILPLATQPSVSVITISVLVTINGLLMIVVAIGFVLAVKYEGASNSKMQYHSILLMPGIIIIILAVVSVAFGVAAGALIPTLSESIQTNTNSSLFSIRDSPGVRDAWNAAQDTFRCCGVMSFSDYEKVFDNLSVPVSCCNLLSNESTCIVDVTNNMTHNTLYSEGCASQLESFFQYILSVIAGVSIIVGLLQIIGEIFSISSIVWKEYRGDRSTKGLFAATYACFQITAVLILACGVSFMVVAIWALVQNSSFYYSITAQANAKVVILSVLIIISGAVMTAISICQLVTAIKGLLIDDFDYLDTFGMIFCRFCCELAVVCASILPILVVIGAGIKAATLSETSMEFSSTLSNYSIDQSVQAAWNAVQENLECCGAVNFTDYRAIFNNFSVPVSCCNSSHPLVSSCSEIAQQIINQTDIIYSKGCASQLESFFMNIFRVVGGVSISIGSLQFIAAIMWLLIFIWISATNCTDYLEDLAP